MSLAAKYLPRYTYSDYILWKGDWELIDGIPYSMSPSARRIHQRIFIKLTYVFNIALNGCSNCELLGELDWIIDDHTTVRPDLLIDCEKLDDDFLRNTPKLVIEILSPSTAHKDRNLKYELYEKQGVKYYLIVNAIDQVIEIYVLEKGNYKKQTEINEAAFEFDFEKCKINVDFKNIWK